MGHVAAFRNRAAHALAAVEQAQYLSEDLKTAHRQLIQFKKESLISAYWRSLMMTNCWS